MKWMVYKPSDVSGVLIHVLSYLCFTNPCYFFGECRGLFFNHKLQYLFPVMAKDWSLSWGYKSGWHHSRVTQYEKKTANGAAHSSKMMVPTSWI